MVGDLEINLLGIVIYTVYKPFLVQESNNASSFMLLLSRSLNQNICIHTPGESLHLGILSKGILLKVDIRVD